MAPQSCRRCLVLTKGVEKQNEKHTRNNENKMIKLYFFQNFVDSFDAMAHKSARQLLAQVFELPLFRSLFFF